MVEKESKRKYYCGVEQSDHTILVVGGRVATLTPFVRRVEAYAYNATIRVQPAPPLSTWCQYSREGRLREGDGGEVSTNNS